METRSLKIKRETLNDKVEQQLRKMLMDGTWKPGERLPPEGELAELFGVSRLTLRMALQKLSASGLVTIRAGDGTFAKEFSLRSYLDAASDLYVTPEMLEDVCEFRKLVEIECARLACQRAVEEDYQAMQKACDAYLEIIRKGGGLAGEGLRQRVRVDLDFHYSLCRAAHNSMYTLAYNAAQGAIAKHLEMIIPSRIQVDPRQDFVPDGRTFHQYILDTVKQGDAQACCSAYLTHIDHHVSGEEYGRRLQTLENLQCP